MTTEQMSAYKSCIANGLKYITHCGATYDIAIEALQELNRKDKARLEALKKEEDRLRIEAEATRAKLERNANRQKEIMELKKAKDAAQRKIDILLKEDEAEKDAELETCKEKGNIIAQKLKDGRERATIKAASGSLKLCLRADR